MYAEFDDTLVTGNHMIDSQHKELIGKINDLLVSCNEGGGRQAAVRMLGYLADYTDFHFSQEEALQEQIGYPQIGEHKEKHSEFKRSVQELHEMLEEQEGPSQEFVDQVNKNVRDWLFCHIKTFDRSVAEYKIMKEKEERL